jgi:hypothetical protein
MEQKMSGAVTVEPRLNFGPGDRPRASRQLEIFAIRALDLADQVAAGQLRFLDAVDMAYEAAAPPSTEKSKYFPPELSSAVIRSKTGRQPITLPRLKFLNDGGGA